ncbi:MAG: glycoside hydrolase 43 family protein [Lachnospiraceae bacterium]|nr:glycoside hydrolase 43 family protein [Lachnospiraceae bacterium]
MVTIKNPVIWADFPDNDVIREDDAFYMVTTSMHSMPGCPIMKSYDLQHWEIVSYCFSRLSEKDGNNLENGQNIYGQGSWAASLRKVGEWYYCLFNSNDDHHAYLFRTRNIESSEWERYLLPKYMHDPSLLIDDDGRKYIVYGNHEIYITELSDDMRSLKNSGPDRLLFTTESENMGLKAEGSHAYKIDGRYYVLMIEWPRDGHGRRREVCYRSDSLDGPFEHRIILDDDCGYNNAGVAQGAIFTLPGCAAEAAPDGVKLFDKKGPEDKVWAAVMFQDHGAVGRIPYVLPVVWEDGWPMLGDEGRAPKEFALPITAPADALYEKSDGNVILAPGVKGAKNPKDSATVCSAGDDFRRLPGQERALTDPKHFWQWNHNPDDALWSLKERPGYLRLINGHINDHGILQARNTLTQRTCGPKCSCRTHIDLRGLKDGDCCGLAAIQGQFGLVGVRIDDEEQFVVMCVNDGNGRERAILNTPYDAKDIWLKISFDFTANKDTAEFEYSADGKTWEKAGSLQLKYTLDHFMGCRMGLYSYATLKTGGFADFEYFKFKG